LLKESIFVCNPLSKSVLVGIKIDFLN
jgi:hypothetical protein